MKSIIKTAIKGVFLILLIIYTSNVKAQENSLKLYGELSTDERFRLKDNNAWSWNENRLDLKLEKKIPDKAKFYSDVWLRNIGVPNLTSSSQLYDKNQVSPYNIDIREAYVELYGFLFKNLDIKLGKQRIAWGTADKLNPTDNLNPYDLEDILDFGRHNGSEAINMTYYLTSDFYLQGVYIPFFRPATMPLGSWSSTFTPEMTLPQGMQLRSFNDTLMLPEYNLEESSIAGLKFKGFLKGYDFSLSYVYGRDGLPLANKNTFTPVDTMGGVNINSQLIFPRTHIIGADLAGSIGSIGIWAEAAAFIPEDKITMFNDLTGFGMPLMDTVILNDEPYFKFVIGADYTFGDGSYLNFQYLHGFIHERGVDALNDYFMFAYEKKIFDEKLKITPIGGGFIVSDWDDIENNYAMIFAPQISYQATDNAEITIGAFILDGKGSNIFASVKDFDEVFFKVKYSF